MHTDILTAGQVDLLPYIRTFKRSFYLVGGTAIALHMGHRHSIDFDLFTAKQINKTRLKGQLAKFPFRQTLIFEDTDQLHLMLNNVKITFFSYPFIVPHAVPLDSIITIPTLLSLAAMKAFALGRRAKWKDYVDLYFILHDYYSVIEISEEAGKIFGQQFSEKLFRQQLAFHMDIDYSEPVEFIQNAIQDQEIKDFLTEKATDLY